MSDNLVVVKIINIEGFVQGRFEIGSWAIRRNDTIYFESETCFLNSQTGPLLLSQQRIEFPANTLLVLSPCDLPVTVIKVRMVQRIVPAQWSYCFGVAGNRRAHWEYGFEDLDAVRIDYDHRKGILAHSSSPIRTAFAVGPNRQKVVLDLVSER